MKNLFLLSVVLAIVVFAGATVLPSATNVSESEACWRQSYGQVTQGPLKWCDANQTFLREDCYDNCDEGFSAGDSSDTSEWEQSDPYESDTDISDYPLLTYCWQDCPEGLTDIGGKSCANLTSWGLVNYVGNDTTDDDGEDTEEVCLSKNSQGCEKCEGSWVPKSECGHCSMFCPVTCPSSMTQDGLNCSKQGYNRVPVSRIQCPTNFTLHNAKCYPPAKEGFTCDGGFLCWELCPEGWSACGAMCVQNKTLCTGKLRNVANNVYGTILDNSYSSDESDATVQAVASEISGIQPYLSYPTCS